MRAILVVVTGALVLALRDPSRFPEAYRSGALWAGTDASVAPDTRSALRARRAQRASTHIVTKNAGIAR